MAVVPISGVRSALSRMQGRRGLRAGIAVGTAAFVCLELHRPLGWAALGGLYVCLVDNGGPYRSRLGNMLTVLLLGSAAVLLGSLAGVNLPIVLLATLACCFTLTLARVVSQPLAASSVFILICFIVATGSSRHTLAAGATGALEYLCGGLWAAALALVLWPVDPFRPARLAIADVYAALSQLADALPSTATPAGATHFNELLGQTRLRIEAAQFSLAATPARLTARTIRARNLTVLNESADLLLARLLRFAELGDSSPPLPESLASTPVSKSPEPPSPEPAASPTELPPGRDSPRSIDSLKLIDTWLTASLQPIEAALRHRPLSGGTAFAADGSLSVELHRSAARLEAALPLDPTLSPGNRAHLIAALRDALYNIDIAFESVRAIWTGVESRQRDATRFRSTLSGQSSALAAPWVWLETLRSNLTLRSVMFRHALRLSAVVVLDVVISRFIHVTHGYWLAMTSLITLRPFAGETVRRSGQRVAGTVAGGILAAAFTAVFSTSTELLVLVIICSAGCVAMFAVDYAWYCFFVTPAIILLTLPKLHDWHLAAIRTEMTFLGAVVSLLAMLLLWPERESLQLPGLLARAAAADAAYLRATLAFWQSSRGRSLASRIEVERSLLAPARRLCGLAVNDAEETLDHSLLEHALPLNPRRAPTQILNSASLTFTTYLRRITRTTTTLAAVGLDPVSPDPTVPSDTDRKVLATDFIQHLAARLDAIGHTLTGAPSLPFAASPPPALPESLALDQLRRLERQVSILERTAAELTRANFL